MGFSGFGFNGTISRRCCLLAAIATWSLAIDRVNAAVQTLDNGVVGNGHLRITTDDFGSFADAFQGGATWLDLFNPSPDPVEGELPEEFATFSTNLFFFVDPSTTGQGTVRGVASSHVGIRAIYNNGNLNCTLTTPNTTNMLPLATSSTFGCVGGGVRLAIELTQRVSVQPPGPNGELRAKIDQTYRIKNIAGGPVALIVVKHIDEDMPWGGGANYALDDLVGADFAELDRPQVFAQDRELITAAMNLRTREDMELDPRTIDFIYYAGKQSILPPGNPEYPGGACPEFDYGTDLEVWDNYGAPNCWKNHVAGVGNNVAGLSPQLSGDSHIGLQVEANIIPQDTYEVTFATVYGFRPEPTLQIPPVFESQTIRYNQSTGCGEFLWSLTNINPIVAGKDPVDITTYYIDVEAGTGGDNVGCYQMIPPPGWTAAVCQTDAPNGHRLFKFTGGAPIARLEEIRGRLIVDTNGNMQTNNPVTGAQVPALSVLLHAAQQQEDEACNFTFGPSTNGDWSSQVIATAFLPVPAMSAWAKSLLALVVIAGGFLLVMRSRKPMAV